MGTPKIGRKLSFIKQPVETREWIPVENKQVVGVSEVQEEYDPEVAAEILMEYLPEDTQMLIREAQQGQQVPLWQMLLGYVMIVSDRAELFAPYILASWEAGKKPNEPRPCETCHVEFRSRFAQAKYCCATCHFGKLAEFGHTADCPTGLGKTQEELVKV